MKLPLLCLVAVLSLSMTVVAQEGNIPPIVARGFATYQRDGALAAVNSWFTGSARESDGGLQDDAVARLGRVQGWLGKMTGYESIRTVVLSKSTRRVYLVVKFEKGVAWMAFDCYQPDKEWIVTRFEFNTNAGQVLPPNILGGQ
ncbi:MAG TPA: hypothetical protein VGO11_12610 [Chthoniobacteraceae bacterium]|nr:hypothetical protein [Chthoniobacteraceae bacterium]